MRLGCIDGLDRGDAADAPQGRRFWNRRFHQLSRSRGSFRKFKGCARCGQREFVRRAVVPPILAPKKPAS